MMQGVTSPLVTRGAERPRDRVPVVSPLQRQWLAALGPLAAVTSCGMTSGYSAVLLPQLQHRNSTLTVTDEEGSWIASTAVLSMALGCVLSGPIMDRYGRRLAHQVSCLPFALGWLLLAGATSVHMLYAGRLLTGLCVGLVSPLATVFIAETAGPRARGPLLAVVSFCVALGILMAHLLGTFLRWDHAAALSALLPVICFLGVAMVPDTPTWLLSRGQNHQAERSFCWYRGHDAPAQEELQQLLLKHKPREQQGFRLSDLQDPAFLKPFAVMNVFFAVQQWSGVNAVTFYTVHILQKVGLRMDEFVATLLLDAVRLLLSTATCVLLKRFGRRPLTAVSGLGSALSLLALAATLLLGPAETLSWLPVLCLVAYVSFVSVGLVPLPWVMLGEVFPAATRGVGSGLSSCTAFLCFFSVVKTGPAMLTSLGADGTFLTYGVVALLGTLFLHLWLPETRNRTLQEIEDGFRSSSSSRPVQ